MDPRAVGLRAAVRTAVLPEAPVTPAAATVPAVAPLPTDPLPVARIPPCSRAPVSAVPRRTKRVSISRLRYRKRGQYSRRNGASFLSFAILSTSPGPSILSTHCAARSVPMGTVVFARWGRFAWEIHASAALFRDIPTTARGVSFGAAVRVCFTPIFWRIAADFFRRSSGRSSASKPPSQFGRVPASTALQRSVRAPRASGRARKIFTSRWICDIGGVRRQPVTLTSSVHTLLPRTHQVYGSIRCAQIWPRSEDLHRRVASPVIMVGGTAVLLFLNLRLSFPVAPH